MTRSTRAAALAAALLAGSAAAQEAPPDEPTPAPFGLPDEAEGVAGRIAGPVLFPLRLEPGVDWSTFVVEVPEGAPALVVAAVGANVDLDLYLRRGARIERYAEGAYDHGATSALWDEVLVVDGASEPPLAAGTYYLDVHAVDGVAEATVLAAFSSPAEVAARLDGHLEVAPGDAAALLVLAMVRSADGDAAGARAALDRALEIDPLLHRAYCLRAFVRDHLGEAAGAAADYARAVELFDGYDHDVSATLGPGEAHGLPGLGAERRYASVKVQVPEEATLLRVTAPDAEGVQLFARYGLPINDWSVDPDHDAPDGPLRITLESDPPLRAGAYYVDVVALRDDVAPFELRVEVQ